MRSCRDSTTSATRVLRMCLLTLCISLSSVQARAANYQDLWWNPSESGWGIQLVQQADIIFATWFVYDRNSQPLWFTAVARRPAGSTANVYSGDVAGITGTFFGALPFSGINPRTAGQMSLNFTDANHATLTYSYDGTQVTKAIERQTFAAISLAGTYFGGLSSSATNCTNPALNGSRVDPATYSVTHTAGQGNNANISIIEVGGTSCRFTGTTQQFGSAFTGTGTYNCAGNGTTGTWTGREGSGGETTFSMRLALTPDANACTIQSVIGGFKSQ